MRFTSIYRKASLVMLLVTLLSGFLPARKSMARSFFDIQSFDSTTPVTVPAAVVRDQLWITHATGRADALQRYEMMAFARVLYNMYRQDPALPAATATQRMQALQQAYSQRLQTERPRSGQTANESILSVFAILSSASFSTQPSYTAVVASARDAYHLTLGNAFVSAGAPDDRLASAPEMYQETRAAETANQTILQDALTLAKANSAFGAAFDTLFGASFDASVYDNAATLIAESEALQALPRVLALLDPGGAVVTTPAELKELTVTYFAQVTRVTTESTTLMNKQNKGEANKETVENKIKEIKPLLKEAKSALPIISKIVGYIDPWFGEQIASVGDTAIKVADAALTIVGAIDLVVGAATPLGVIKMVGTIAGTLGGVFGLFKEADKPAGPKPEKVILDQIRELRNQVRDMHIEMRQRFDRIDTAINTMYETMLSRFDQIDLELQVIDGNLREIQASLVQIQRDLNRVEKNLQAAISDGFQQNLWLDIDGGLGYRERLNREMPYIPTFADYESSFYTWATNFASSGTYILPAQGPWDDAAAYDLLNTYPPDKTLNYLAQLPSQRWGLPALSTQHLPNPRVWSLSSQAYTRLALDWPHWANEMPLWQQRAETIAQKGRQLQDALSRITTIPSGNGLGANYGLWNELVDNYRWWSVDPDNARSVVAELQAIEASYLNTLKLGDPNSPNDDRQGLLNLWGGAGQQLAQGDIPALDTIKRCGAGSDPLAAPANLKPQLVPTPYLVAQYLRFGQIQVCYSAELTDEKREVRWECIEMEPGKPCKMVRVEECISQDLWFHVIADFAGQRIGINSNLIYDDGACYDTGAPNRNWAHWKAVIEGQLAQASYADPERLAATTTQVNDALRTHQRQLYDQVIAGFNAGPLQVAAKKLSGAKALLDHYVSLGLPRALEQDEVLRSLLVGTQRMLDEDAERRMTAIYSNARNTLPGNNVRTGLTTALEQRHASLRTTLWIYLDRINTGQHVESTRLLETTQDRQRMARALVDTPVANVAPSPVVFGRQVAGAESSTRVVTVSNGGMVPLAIGAISLGGQHSADFTLTGTCAGELAAGASCTISVTFRARAAGTRIATLSIATGAPNSPQIVALSGTAVTPAPPRNLIANPGFESGLASDPTRPSNWTLHAAVTRGTTRRSGEFAMRHLTTTDAGYTVANSAISNLVPGGTYAFSGWFNIPAATGADASGFAFAVDMQWRNSANAPIATTRIKRFTATTNGAWSQVVAQVVPPATATSGTLMLVATSLKGEVLVDDLFFGNLLANGGFELDANVDGRPDSWTANQYVAREAVVKHSGAAAMRHQAANNANYIVSQAVSGLVAGARLNLTGNVRIPNTSDAFTFVIEVQWRNAANAVLSTSPVKSFTAQTGDIWSPSNANLTVPEGATSAHVRMVVQSLNATIYVDGLSLRP